MYSDEFASPGFMDTNNLLRTGTLEMNSMTEMTADPKETLIVMALANSALSKLPPHKQDVNRTAYLSKIEVHELYIPGQTVKEHGFTSTSSKGLYGGHSPVHYKIRSKKSRDISMISNNPDENECLFRPGSSFKVAGVEEANNGTLIVTMDEE
ncbi:MAG: hypothetical protein ACI9S8_000979 [Chlamydiales bacterium]|jgi:hypothetical protein